MPVTRFYERPSLHVEVYDALHAGADPGRRRRRVLPSPGARDRRARAGAGCRHRTGGRSRSPRPASTSWASTAHRRCSRSRKGNDGRCRPTSCRRLRFVEGDMTDLRLRRRFGLVFAAFRVFMALADVADQRRALAGVRRQLRPGGLLVLDVFDPRLDRLVHGPLEELWSVATFIHPTSGNAVTVAIWSAHQRRDPPGLHPALAIHRDRRRGRGRARRGRGPDLALDVPLRAPPPPRARGLRAAVRGQRLRR